MGEKITFRLKRNWKCISCSSFYSLRNFTFCWYLRYKKISNFARRHEEEFVLQHFLQLHWVSSTIISGTEAFNISCCRNYPASLYQPLFSGDGSSITGLQADFQIKHWYFALRKCKTNESNVGGSLFPVMFFCVNKLNLDVFTSDIDDLGS